MKFLHLADLHLGKTVNEFRMIDDQKYILDQILQIVKERKIDCVLIAGDVYDKNIPSEEAVALLDDLIRSLAQMDVKVFMISGNHDSDVRLDFGKELFREQGIYITGVYDGTVPCVTLQDEYGPVQIWSLPFVKASRVAHFHPDADTSSYDAAVRSALADCDIDRSRRNVLLAHQFVTASGMDPETAGSENSSSDQVGTIEKVDVSAFDGFSYVALGHIHRPQRVGRDTVRYAGSPLKYSLSEAGHRKSAVLIDMTDTVSLELIDLVPVRDMRHLKGPMEKILDPANISAPQDYVYVTLTDEEVIPDAMGRIRAYYPNCMKLDYENSHTNEIENGSLEDVTQISFEEQMSKFYQLAEGQQPGEEEWKILTEAAKEAGVIDEAG